jgi:hypothetical protein
MSDRPAKPSKKPVKKPLSAAAKAAMAKRPTLAQIRKVEAIRKRTPF